jgi:hypothetical protein
MNFLNFLLFLWVVFALLDPDPGPADQNQCGSGSETLVGSVTVLVQYYVYINYGTGYTPRNGKYKVWYTF